MATPAATLAILVTANTKQANAALAKTNAQLGVTTKAATASSVAMKRLGTAAKFGGLFLAGGLAVGLKKSVDEAREANKVMAQTNAVIKSTGGAAKVTAKEVEALSERLSEKAGVDDEAIQSGANLLLTFKNIRNEAGKGNDVFDRTTSLALDMSAALGQDMKSSAIQLGKALNDPSVGLTALRRVGVSFTAQQSEQILKMQESGDLMKAQKTILAELSDEFRGSAKAQADAGDRLRVVFDNIAEDVGMKVVPALEKMANKVSDVLSNKKLTGDEKAERLANYFTKLFSKGLDALTGALPEIAEAGGRIGLKLIESIGKAFVQADLLGKIFLAATFIRLIGGKGVLTTLGTKLGSIVGRSFGLGMVTLGAALIWANRKEIIAAAEKIADHIKALMNITPAASKFLSEASDIQIENALKNQEKGTDFYKQLVSEARSRGILFRKITEDTWRDIGRETKNGSDRAGDLADKAHDRMRKGFDKSRRAVDSTTRRQTQDVVGNTNNMVNAVGQGLKRLGSNTNKALKAFGAKPVNFAIVSGSKVGTSGLQRGGPINEGAPSGDSVPAMLEKGEYVLNRNAVKAMGKGKLDAINFGAASRFQKGGVVEALGPYAIPPFSYDANHAGGNSHMHIAMSTTSAVVALGKQLQRMGMMVGEHPAFGGVGGMHAPGGYHYTAQAIDVNTAADETRSEVARVAALLNGGKFKGALAQKLKRILLKGPDGPLKDMGQGSLDKAHKAANAFLAKMMPAEGMEAGIGAVSTKGPLQAIAKRMVTSRWGGGQWPFFNDLVNRESGWDPTAVNPRSGAAGLAQALPPSKYPAGAWPYTGKSSAVKQLQWMVQYVAERYGTPAGAIDWHNSHNWYQQGGIVGLQGGGDPGGNMAPPFKGIRKLARSVPRLRDRLKKITRKIGKTDERLSIAQQLASLESSPGGSGLSGAEKTQQLGLLDTLEGQLLKQQRISQEGLKLSKRFGFSPSAFKDSLLEVQGLTGKGGRLFDTMLAKKELQGTSLAGSLGISIDDLLRIHQASQLGLFAGTFGGGGSIPRGKWGIAGDRGPEIVQGPAQVHSNQDSAAMLSPEVHLHFAPGTEWLRDFVQVELRDRDRSTELRRRQGALR